MVDRCQIGCVGVICTTLFFVFLVLFVERDFVLRNDSIAKRFEIYEYTRDLISRHEYYIALGGQITLTEKERQVNKLIMDFKEIEYKKALKNPDSFNPAKYYYQAYREKNLTSIFNILRLMPKGGLLNVPDGLLCKIDYLIKLTYNDLLWICVNQQNQYNSLKFSREMPKSDNYTGYCEWTLLNDLRVSNGSMNVDIKLKNHFKIHVTSPEENVNKTENKFYNSFIHGFITYKPIWELYHSQALKEFFFDGAIFLEMRSSLPTLYDLNNTKYSVIDAARTLFELSNNYRNQNPDFLGLKIIYAPPRLLCCENDLKMYIDNSLKLKETFPNDFLGLDLDGLTGTDQSLNDIALLLVYVQNKISFYCNSRKFNAYDSYTSENLIEAVALGCKRLGHDYELVKHPELLRLVKRENLVIETIPISKSIIENLHDFRNHPGAFFITNGFPIVLSPSESILWKSSPITHDFYVAFTRIATQSADLKLLKFLTSSSLYYSSLSYSEKMDAYVIYDREWQKWIDDIYNGYFEYVV